MEAQSKRTKDHEEIKRWAEERDGKPAIVKGTENIREGAGILRINFPGYAEENLQETDWDTFFETFDERHLEFLYQEETKEGSPSRFFKFVKEEA